MQALRSSAVLRTAARAKVAQPPMMHGAVSSRRFASTVAETANKAKEQVAKAAETIKGDHHKASSDVPWMVGSVLVFAPLLVWLSSPPSKKHDDHHAPAKEKFKPHLRLPPGADKDPEAEDAHRQQEAPEEFGDLAGEGRPHGEGDHGLRAQQDESSAAQDKQKSPDKQSSASNHDQSSGLKGDPEKFQAAARGSQIAFQSGGGEAARDTHALTQAGRAASKDKDEDSGYSSSTVPESTGEKVEEKISEKKEDRGEENDEKASGDDKKE